MGFSQHWGHNLASQSFVKLPITTCLGVTCSLLAFWLVRHTRYGTPNKNRPCNSRISVRVLPLCPRLHGLSWQPIFTLSVSPWMPTTMRLFLILKGGIRKYTIRSFCLQLPFDREAHIRLRYRGEPLLTFSHLQTGQPLGLNSRAWQVVSADIAHINFVTEGLNLSHTPLEPLRNLAFPARHSHFRLPAAYSAHAQLLPLPLPF